jgi:hypothetical protein
LTFNRLNGFVSQKIELFITTALDMIHVAGRYLERTVLKARPEYYVDYRGRRS